MTGTVYLVGAGPGDAGLMTLKGMSCLKKADVVLMDHLVSPTCLTVCKDDVQIIDVGKQKGKHSATQDQINVLLKTHATTGNTVVRLKGGDPMIFGRAGEEIQYLSKHNIAYQVIPGVSSAIAGPAMAGIPLTHRNKSRSVAFMTGTLKRGETPITLPKADTLVFLMALSHCDQIAQNLIQTQALSPKTPACMISQATLATQKQVTGTLDTIAQLSKELPTPALLVVGDVAAFSTQTTTEITGPLQGKRVVILRDKRQGQAWLEALEASGAEVVHLPLIQIQMPEKTLQSFNPQHVNDSELLIFSSQNAVTAFFKALTAQALDVRSLSQKRIIAFGTQTVEALKERGILADDSPKNASMAGLIEAFGDSIKGKTSLWPTSVQAADTLPRYITENGGICYRENLYETQAIPVKAGHIHDKDIIIFSSPSTVDSFCQQGLVSSSHHYIAIGPRTQTQCKKQGIINAILVENPDIKSIVNKIIEIK